MNICPKAEECSEAEGCPHSRPHESIDLIGSMECTGCCDTLWGEENKVGPCVEHKDDSAISDKAYRHLHVLLFSTVTGAKNDPEKAVDINALADTIVGIVKKG